MDCETIENIYNHAMHLRNIGQEDQAKIYIVGCYSQHTKPNCVLRDYWAQLRSLHMKGTLTYGEFVMQRNYYEMASRLIAHLFGRFAWYNTLS